MSYFDIYHLPPTCGEHLRQLNSLYHSILAPEEQREALRAILDATSVCARCSSLRTDSELMPYMVDHVLVVTKGGDLVYSRGTLGRIASDPASASQRAAELVKLANAAFASGKDSRHVREFSFGDSSVAVVEGSSLILVAFLRGHLSASSRAEAEQFLARLEKDLRSTWP